MRVVKFFPGPVSNFKFMNTKIKGQGEPRLLFLIKGLGTLAIYNPVNLLEYILGYQVDPGGVIRDRRTKKVITALGAFNSRQRRRYFFKVLKAEFQQLANAAGSATAGGWNH